MRRFLSGVAVLLVALVGPAVAVPPAHAATPVAPALVAPATGASVLTPFGISWSAVVDPVGVTAYNWQLSPTSSFATVVEQGSTTAPRTDATVSGVAPGTWFWRVQAVDAVAQGTWSSARSVVVTGVGPTSPGTPLLAPPLGGTRAFHPFESIHFTWSAVATAATYTFEVTSTAFPQFPVLQTRVRQDNIIGTTTQTTVADFCDGCEQGTYLARVYAVSANGIRGVASATQAFSVFYANPLPPPPKPLSPVGGVTVTDPVSLVFSPSPNPQELGYEVEVSHSSTFATIEDDFPFFTAPTHDETNLTSGPSFWRVRSFQGDNSPTTAAVTAWSAPAAFTVSTAPPVPGSLTLTRPSPFSGDDEFLGLQLTAVAASAGTPVTLTSSDPAALSVPTPVTVPRGFAQDPDAISLVVGQVAVPTPVTLTARVGSATAAVRAVVQPPSLTQLSFGAQPTVVTGGTTIGPILYLQGSASGGAAVQITSSVPAAVPAESITLTAGSPTTRFSLSTRDVASPTAVTVTATWNGTSVRADLTVLPSPRPVGLAISPSTTSGFGSVVQGTVTVAAAPSADSQLQVTSDDPSFLIFLPTTVTVAAGSTTGSFSIPSDAVMARTVVHVTVSGGGASVSAPLTIDPGTAPPPPPAPTLTSLVVSPDAVGGGTSATGTITLPGPAPAGGLVVSLSTNLPLAATTPTSVTVPAGATSARFVVTTHPVDRTTVEVFASNGPTSLVAPLGILVAPGTPGSGVAVTVKAVGRSGVSIVSTPAGLDVPVGTSAAASFAGAITLTATDGRDVIWSGGCSSEGAKVKSCTFTPGTATTVTAAVQ